LDYVASGNVALLPGQSLQVFILGFDAKNAGGTLLLDNVQLKGSVGPAPEPSTATLALAGLLLSARRLWR
jgi:hypothetical protein